MKEVFLVYGIKTMNTREPKFKFAIVESTIATNKEIPHKSVLFWGCEINLPEHISEVLRRAKVYVEKEGLKVKSAMNGFYVSQSSMRILPVEQITDKKTRSILDQHFGIFKSIPELNFEPVPVSAN